MFVERLRRAGEIVEVEPETVLRTGDVLAGLVVAVAPHVAAVLVGRFVLRMVPLTLLGACSGAGTNTAVLRAIQDVAASRQPAVGYTVPYAIGNILLTAWGPVLVALMS